MCDHMTNYIALYSIKAGINLVCRSVATTTQEWKIGCGGVQTIFLYYVQRSFPAVKWTPTVRWSPILGHH